MNRKIPPPSAGTTDGPRAPRMAPARLVPLLILMAGLIAFFAFDLDDYLSFDTLRQNRHQLSQLVADHTLAAVVGFILLYVAVIAFSLPGGAVLSITGGFLFGWLPATLYIVIGATLGATILFVAAKTAFADFLRARAGDTLRKMEDGFRHNAFNYLLVLRLVPLFPFWLVNLVPALIGVPLRTYVLATMIGIIPGTAVYASVGSGLGTLFDQGQTPDLGIVFEPDIFLPLMGLALLALIPVVYEKRRSQNRAADR